MVCCAPDGSCTISTSGSCPGGNSQFGGGGATCQPNPCLPSGPPAPGCSVSNSSFESGSFSSWTQFDNTGFSGVTGTFQGVQPHGGAFQAFFGPVDTTGGISQVIPANVGDSVTVTFWLANLSSAATHSFSADFDGQNLVSLVNDASKGFTQFSYNVVVTGANPVLSFTFRNDPSYYLLDDVSVCVQAGANIACCNVSSGACSVAAAGTGCPAGTTAAPNGAGSCSPWPCPNPGSMACADCPWPNGAYDGRSGQLSHLGGSVPNGAKAADDFYLCEKFVYDLSTITATLLTTTTPGLVKPKAEIWSDCNGCPGTLLYTFDQPLVVETGLDAGPAFDGRPLRIVHATFDVSRETTVANRNVVLKGGNYWLSVYGRTDGLGPTMQMYDATYWGTTAGPIKGKPAYKINGLPSNTYNVYSFPTGCGLTAWHSVVDECCIGCTDLNFTLCAAPCKVLNDNGGALAQVNGAVVGSTSQFADANSLFDTRTADDFVVPPCADHRVCYIEGCVLTDCLTFDGKFEIYANDCNHPSYSRFGTPLYSGAATKIIDLGYSAVLDGRARRAYRLEFHDLNFVLGGGRQYWISLGVAYTFSLIERGYFCYNDDCARSCLIRWNNGKVLTATSIADGTVNTPGWASTGHDYSYLIAATPVTTNQPMSGSPSCSADINRDGVVNVQDVFDYLSQWFTGCP